MKTLFINGSPKTKRSASALLCELTAILVKGEKEKLHLRSKADYKKILDRLEEADNLVFAMPLYVDGLPSHILPFLQEVEAYSRTHPLKARVYVLANNGFIEGRQNEPLLQIMENFCDRSGLTWSGGLGVGGGVMMNVMTWMTLVFFGLTLFSILYGGLVEGNFLQTTALLDFGKQVLVLLLLASGILYYDLKLGLAINQQKDYGKHYTRIQLPSFLFILCADLFFFLISLLQCGLFRGWLAKKQPTDTGPVSCLM